MDRLHCVCPVNATNIDQGRKLTVANPHRRCRAEDRTTQRDPFCRQPCPLGRGLLSGQTHPHGHITWHLQKKTPLFQVLAQFAQWGRAELQLVCPCTQDCAPQTQSTQVKSLSSLCLRVAAIRTLGLRSLNFHPNLVFQSALSAPLQGGTCCTAGI